MKSKKIKSLVTVVTVLSIVATTAVGCTKSKSSDQGTPNNATVTSADPLGKYSPEIKISFAKYQDDTTKYPDGQSAADNSWIREYKNTLGIDVAYDWIVSNQQAEQKMNVTIASGDLPDIFPVNATQLKSLIEEGSIADITDVYNQYASPLTKGIIDQDKNVFELGKSDGKLYGIPNTGGTSSIDAPPILYIREDWRKKLNLPEPKTMDDLMKICEAFTTQDPDGNGKKDTYGLAIDKDFETDGFAGAQGFFNAFHAYPTNWIKDSSGKLVYGSVQPEVKTALGKLQEMYKKGEIDTEFAVKDGGKVAEATTSGKVGVEFGAMWNPGWPLESSVEQNPKADWKSYPVPTTDNQPTKVISSVGAMEYWVVRKDFKHPEAIIKMMNLWTEKCWGETADNNLFNGAGLGYIPFKFALVQVWPAKKNVNAHNNVVAALKANDTSKLNAEEKGYYDSIKLYLDKNDIKAGWGNYKIFGEGGSFDVINKYIADKSYIYNEFHGVPTHTMSEKGSTLSKMESEEFSKIIMGAVPIDDFDKFVTDYMKLGGKDITQEMNSTSSSK